MLFLVAQRVQFYEVISNESRATSNVELSMKELARRRVLSPMTTANLQKAVQ